MSKGKYASNYKFDQTFRKMKKYNAWIGVTAVVLSTLTIIVMAELRTDGYSHAHKAVSELGTVDAPNKWIFNISGYFIPGVLIALFAYNLKNEFTSVPGIKTYPFYFFIGSGILMSVAGIFPGDLDHKTSFTTTMHLAGAIGSGLLWLICVFTLWWQLKKKAHWESIALANLCYSIHSDCCHGSNAKKYSRNSTEIFLWRLLFSYSGARYPTVGNTGKRLQQLNS